MMVLMTVGSALAESASVRVEGIPPDKPTVLATVVQYGDIDVSTNDGAKVLLTRIDEAALRVCGARNGKPSAFVSEASFESCRKHAVDDAVALVHAPMLTKVAASP
jgi:UrcA family protein